MPAARKSANDVTGRRQEQLQRQHASEQLRRERELAMVTQAEREEVDSTVIDLTTKPEFYQNPNVDPSFDPEEPTPVFQHAIPGADEWRDEQSRLLPLGATKQPGMSGVSIDNAGVMTDTGQPGWARKTNDSNSGKLAVPAITGITSDNAAGTLTPSTAYSYKVTALNARGESLPSAAFPVTTGAAATETILTWGAVSGATGYKIYGRKAGKEALIATVGAVTTYTDTGTAVGTAVPPLVDISGYGVGAESPFPVVGGTIADQLKRPVIDTRNATNVGTAGGPDPEAPRAWTAAHEQQMGGRLATLTSPEPGLAQPERTAIEIVMMETCEGVTWGAGNHVDLYEGRRYKVPKDFGNSLIDKGYAR